MNIDAIKHIIIVPATDETAADPHLMAQLLDQMGQYRGLSLVILRPSPCKIKITETATHLLRAILDNARATDSFSQFSYDTPERDGLLAPRAAAKAHFDAALKADNPPAQVMVLVVEPRIAPVMTLAILIDTLDDKGTDERMIPLIEAGGAATINCRTRRRGVLHPEGNDKVVLQSIYAGRRLRPAT